MIFTNYHLLFNDLMNKKNHKSSLVLIAGLDAKHLQYENPYSYFRL